MFILKKLQSIKGNITLLVFLLLSMQVDMLGQNPFDITTRIKQTTVEAEVDTIPSTVSNNPFDIDRSTDVDATAPAQNQDSPSKRKGILPTWKNNTNSATPSQSNQLFWITLLSLLPLTLFFLLFRSYFTKAYSVFQSSKLLVPTLRETNSNTIIPFNLWFVVFLINGGIFLTLLCHHFGFAFSQNNLFLDCLLFIGMLSLYMTTKFILLFLIGTIFPLTKEIQQYRFLVLLFSIVIGVSLTPLNLVLTYAPSQLSIPVVIISLLFVLFFYLLRAFRGTLIAGKLWSLHRFHFLLYICAIELAPVFILLKFTLNYSYN